MKNLASHRATLYYSSHYYRITLRFFLICALLIFIWLPAARADTGSSVAITIDDLPILSNYLRSEGQLEAITYRFQAQITAENIPVTGFVNESELYVADFVTERRTFWLANWMRCIKSLGNHTYSHLDLHEVGAQEFEDDIVKGWIVTDRLAQQFNVKTKYFRFPFLHQGRTLDEKHEIERFLAARHYRIAPVSINPDDTAFSAPYDDAELQGDTGLQDRLGAAYLDHLAKVIDVSGRLSQSIFKRDVPQILLIHASALNARYFQKIAALFRAAGYHFVSLGEALADPAYEIGDQGYTPEPSWGLQRQWIAAHAPNIPLPPLVPLPDIVH